MTVRTDCFGNIIGRLEGVPSAPAVAAGSHLDTVPEGGNYDGILGVVGALAAIKRITERGPMKHPLELIIFAAERENQVGSALPQWASKTWLEQPV